MFAKNFSRNFEKGAILGVHFAPFVQMSEGVNSEPRKGQPYTDNKPFRLLEHFRFKILPDNWGHFGISGDISFCLFHNFPALVAN